MNQGECTGTIIFIGELDQITANFSKRMIALSYTDQGSTREHHPSFEFINPTKILDQFSVGMKVHITFKPRGNRHKTEKTRFFASLEGINITKL